MYVYIYIYIHTLHIICLLQPCFRHTGEASREHQGSVLVPLGIMYVYIHIYIYICVYVLIDS